jgi:hypothetical protein
MARSATLIAKDIDDFMKRKTLNFWTLTWAQFYTLSQRQRIKDAFLIDLQIALKQNHELMFRHTPEALAIYRNSVCAPQDYP